jgi:hypothetical protein
VFHLRCWRHVTVAGVLLTGILVVIVPRPATAAGCDTWTGAVSDSWDVAGNWTGGVPTGADTVCIPPSSQTVVDAAGTDVSASVRIGAGAQHAVEGSA